MRHSIRNDILTQLAIGIFFTFTVIWVYIQLYIPIEHNIYQAFSATYGLMALFGAFVGLMIGSKWGGFKSVMGKAIYFFSLGLLAQEFGQLTYSYYAHYMHIDIPYPSIGDIGYFGSVPLYIIATLYLARASGVHIGIRSFGSKLQSLFIPFAMLIFSYLFFLKDYVFDWNYPLTVFLDFGYPLGQAIYISIAILTYLLSRNILGGIMKKRVLLILFALLLQYCADYMFLYEAHRGTFYAGGPNDYLYLIAYFVMTFALIQLNNVVKNIKRNNN